jgi:E1-E2 ATPase
MNLTKAVNSQPETVVLEAEPARVRVRRSKALLFSGLRIRILSDERVLSLSGKTIAAAVQGLTRRELINRFFSIPSLKSLRINWRKGEVRLEFATRLSSIAEPLAELAAAMGGHPPEALSLLHEEVVLQSKGFSTFEIHRLGSSLTLWRVDMLSPRVYRLTHPLLRGDFIRKEVLNELATIPDIVYQSLSALLSGGNSLLVFVRPDRIDPTVFQRVLDPVLIRCLSVGKPRRLPKLSGLIVNTNLAVAPLADFLFPQLGLVNLALMAIISLKPIPRALRSLRRGKFTVELVGLAGAVLTAMTYQFLPAAVMFWFMRFWPQKVVKHYELHHRKFLARYRLLPGRFWIERDGASAETRIEELSASSVVALTAGDIVPGDGVVLSGTARIDERLLTGASRHVPKFEGSPIYAASRIENGAVRIKINSLGNDTVVERIAHWHREALRQQSYQHRADDLADHTTLPILLLGAAVLVQGGAHMAEATVQPDYKIGPEISEKISRLAMVIRAANNGIVIAENSPLEKFLKCDSIVFDDSVAWQAPEAGHQTFARTAHDQGFAEVLFFAAGSENHAAKLASRLGFDSFRGSGSEESKRTYVEERQKQGHSVIYVGDCETESAAAEQADVAVSVLDLSSNKQMGKFPIALLFPDLVKILQLRTIVLGAVNEFKLGSGLSLAPNLAAVFGALSLGSPTSMAVMLTNLGMLAAYIRSGLVLHQAEREYLTGA